jgi:hypothetical protein
MSPAPRQLQILTQATVESQSPAKVARLFFVRRKRTFATNIADLWHKEFTIYCIYGIILWHNRTKAL